ncbi:hypothetical protein LZ32DRAFT_453153 [Colletotrichum eremochloae]|nr:hypothetical protein LZ32DRAFT_453153 [Colletotrichum eremochloae]
MLTRKLNRRPHGHSGQPDSHLVTSPITSSSVAVTRCWPTWFVPKESVTPPTIRSKVSLTTESVATCRGDLTLCLLYCSLWLHLLFVR